MHTLPAPFPRPDAGNVVISNLRFFKPVGIGDSIQVRLTGKRKIDRNRKDANGRGV